MISKDEELEVKFYISRPTELKAKLEQRGHLHAPRVHEVNLRFDTPELSLTKTGRLLRLRKDSRARVTYKGEGREEGGARLRQELEFAVSDFDTARKVFEELGYQVTMLYEKYRTIYELGDVEAALDELPMGVFLEIEGNDSQGIRKAASQLDLDWEARILDSYTVLFEQLRVRLGLNFRDLSFANFKSLKISPEQMGVKVAD